MKISLHPTAFCTLNPAGRICHALVETVARAQSVGCGPADQMNQHVRQDGGQQESEIETSWSEQKINRLINRSITRMPPSTIATECLANRVETCCKESLFLLFILSHKRTGKRFLYSKEWISLVNKLNFLYVTNPIDRKECSLPFSLFKDKFNGFCITQGFHWIPISRKESVVCRMDNAEEFIEE